MGPTRNDWANQVREDGFCVIPEVPDLPVELAEPGAFAEAGERRSRAGIRHLMSEQLVSKTARSAGLSEIATAILGPTAIPFRATLFDKSGNANWLVAWHQDTALPLREKREVNGWGPWSVKDGVHYCHAPAEALERVLALRLHLDDSDLDNGPLRVLPKTHTLGVLDDSQVSELAAKIEPVDCTAKKWGVVAMRPLVVHASSKSVSDKPRRVLHIEYAESEEICQSLKLAVT